jgi:hypothetical protein
MLSTAKDSASSRSYRLSRNCATTQPTTNTWRRLASTSAITDSSRS